MHPVLTRRDFLERSALAVGVLALPLEALGTQAKMYISLNGSTAPRVAAWPEKARLAAKLGFGGVDWDFGPAKAAGVDATRALFTELRIHPTICSIPIQQPFAGDDASFKAKLPQLAEDAAFAAAIGGNKMMLVLSATSPLPKNEQRAIVRERLAAISEVLQRSNIRLGLEFLGPLYMHLPTPPAPAVPAAPQAPGAPEAPRAPQAPRVPFIWTLPETVALAKDSGPNIGVVLDIWHWHHSGGTVADILATDKTRIVHVHLSDAKPMPAEDVRDNMRVLPGEGAIDVVAFFQALQRIGYTDGVSPEPLGRMPADIATEDAARLALDTAQAVMRKAGVM